MGDELAEDFGLALFDFDELAEAEDFGFADAVAEDDGLAEPLADDDADGDALDDDEAEGDELADASGLTVVADGTCKNAIALTDTSPMVLPLGSG